ncbi:hypothetical protein CAEBREN_07870 [Caenorhabditis brenneri]|uniref:Uncharacterized protein n=1 Tax=Caenorhabditis brenneri TaxID=135651 RepID=G0N9M3_CAEBE|nr:hypothetical protein CAEBREN_07870 [Caenorhabditis brenneri]
MDISTILFMIICIGLTEETSYKTKRTESITEASTTLKTFPSERWKTASISREKRAYFESSFSKAFFHHGCEYETRLEPVYYYPGETVRLECFMCNIALVVNGLPKGWGRIKNIDEFMEKGQHFGSKDGPDIELVENPKFLEYPTLPSTRRKLGEPYHQQSNGFLIIYDVISVKFVAFIMNLKANAYSQGVYFCFDKGSVASQRHFYVLIPILPFFQVSRKSINQIKIIC